MLAVKHNLNDVAKCSCIVASNTCYDIKPLRLEPHAIMMGVRLTNSDANILLMMIEGGKLFRMKIIFEQGLLTVVYWR